MLVEVVFLIERTEYVMRREYRHVLCRSPELRTRTGGSEAEEGIRETPGDQRIRGGVRARAWRMEREWISGGAVYQKKKKENKEQTVRKT